MSGLYELIFKKISDEIVDYGGVSKGARTRNRSRTTTDLECAGGIGSTFCAVVAVAGHAASWLVFLASSGSLFLTEKSCLRLIAKMVCAGVPVMVAGTATTSFDIFASFLFILLR